MRLFLVMIFNVALSAAAIASPAHRDSLDVGPTSSAPRELAQRLLVEKWLPAVDNFSELRGNKVEDPRLGEPYLEVALRGGDFGRYRDSSVDDPRPFADLLKYVFPIYVADRTDPVMWLVVGRCRDCPIARALPDDHFFFGGYYLGNGRPMERALRLREQYQGQISVVQFVDAGMELTMVETPAGIRAGLAQDTLTPLAECARKIKRNLRNY